MSMCITTTLFVVVSAMASSLVRPLAGRSRALHCVTTLPVISKNTHNSGIAGSSRFAAAVATSRDMSVASRLGVATAAPSGRRLFSQNTKGDDVDRKAKRASRSDEEAKPRERTHVFDTSQMKPWQQGLLKLMGVDGEESRSIRYATALYDDAMYQSQLPQWLKYCEQENSFMFEFQILNIHTWLLFRRCKEEGSLGKLTNQEVYDLVWEDMKPRLRQIGVPPLKLSKQVKELQHMAYGAAVAFERGYDASDAELAAALHRNLFFGECTSAASIADMIDYIRRESQKLAAASLEDLVKGEWDWGEPPVPKYVARSDALIEADAIKRAKFLAEKAEKEAKAAGK